VALKIPPDVEPLPDASLTAIAGVNALKKFVDDDAGLVEQVKERMTEKDAAFATSDLAVAALRSSDGPALGPVDPVKAFALVGKQRGGFTLEQFLNCVTVRLEPLAEFLPGAVIDSLRPVLKGDAKPSPRLTVEWKPNVAFDAKELLHTLGPLVRRHAKQRAI
jgi:hypothetical protein